MLRAYNLQCEQPPDFPNSYRIVKSTVLNRTSLEANNNKFYVLEVHEAGDKYRLFTNYGRVGSEGVKEGRYADEIDAILDEFDRIYREKTGPRKGYLPVEVEKASVGSGLLRAESERTYREKRGVHKCQLPPAVADFVEHIFDESKSELARRIETPLGSLSQNQIERGAEALRALRFAISRDQREEILPLTDHYFSLIPHRLERRRPIDEIAINSIEKADAEEELLQLMRDVYHIQNDLESEVDLKYRALGAQVAPVERDEFLFRKVERQILKTQSERHGFRLRVERLFRVELPDERVRFEQDGRRVGNVRALFHGTKTCNMVGILSRGLLIAPKNAPVNGYMFGKGIYFADRSTKSAQYAFWHGNGRTSAYLFLVDVALGRVKREVAPQYREAAPEGFDSVQGCQGPHLLHNEYIIYHTAQCTLRYIAEIAQA